MSEIDELISDLERGHAGDPWHGPSRAAVLSDVSAEEAGWCPPGGVHSIWEIVLHMTGWTGEMASRLRGAPPRLPAAGDWPAIPPAATDAEWQHALKALDVAHRELVDALREMNPASLGERMGIARDAPLGTGVSYRTMLRGITQHDAYHTGQIAILRRLFRSNRVGS